MRVLRLLLLSALLGLWLSGCTTDKPVGSVLAPWDFHWLVPETALNRDDLAVTFAFASRAGAMERVETFVDVQGPLVVQDGGTLAWTNLPAQHKVTGTVRLRTTGTGKGSLLMRVVGKRDGLESYEFKTGLIFIVGDDVVFAGTGIVSNPEVRYLDYLVAKGGISREEYEQRRQQLVGGGGTVKVTPPTR